MHQRACLLLIGIALGAAADPIDDVRCHEVAFSLAAEARDAERFASFIDADARFVGNSVARGVPEITAAWAPFFADDGPRIRWRPEFVEVMADGGLALTRGPYRMLGTDEEGNETEHWGTFNSVWRQQPDGGWKVVFDAGNPSASPPDAATRALLEATPACENIEAGDGETEQENGVDDGTRTHDDRDHNPGLYQLSYAHHWDLRSLPCSAFWRARQDSNLQPPA